MNGIILWGVGTYAQLVMSEYYIPTELIEYVVDSDENKCGTIFLGKKIIKPEQIKTYMSDILVIGTIQYQDEIKEKVKVMFPDLEVLSIKEFAKNFPKGFDFTRVKYPAERVQKQLKHAGAISQELLENAKLLADRYEAVRRMKNMGGIIGEVGVANGDFSAILLDTLKPEKFYAIDIFNPDNKGFWGTTVFADAGMTHEEYYRERFKTQIAEGKVEILKGMSWDCLNSQEDNLYDYLYVDGDHSFEGVSKDIDVLISKVKNKGIIQFNDYVIWDMYEHTYYGVVPAVNELINKTKSKVLYYCFELSGFADIVIELNKELL